MTNLRSIMYNDSGGTKSAALLDSSIAPAKTTLTITVEELARQLNISRTTAYSLARRKDFYPAFRIGHRTIVSMPALTRWIDEQTEG